MRDASAPGLNTSPSDSRSATGPIIFVAATAPERRVCARSVEIETSVRPIFLQTGMGLTRADELLERATATGAGGLVSIGTAGGLDPSLAPGTLLLPQRVRLETGESFDVDPVWHARVLHEVRHTNEVSTGELLSVNEIVRAPGAKTRWYEQTGATGLDMESGRLAQLAAERSLPFLILRAVMDTADDELPAAVGASVRDDGEIDSLALAAYLLVHVSEIPAMILTLKRYRVARNALRKACCRASRPLLNPR